MKKVLLAVALTALCGLTASTYADVQNIRISGDIRVIGYYLANVGYSSYAQAEGNVNLFEQQTRVKVEADLEDHVLVVVTLKADGLWGANASEMARNSAKTWEVGIDEAYVQLRELFYSPATLTLGRQYLNYGSGLIISSFDKAYNFDAARLVLDYHPLTIDVVAAQQANSQPFKAYNTGTAAVPQTDMLFVNAKYEVNGSMVKTVEGYFGWMAQSGNADSAPMIVGLRTDLTPCENLTASVEGAYEFANGGGNEISAFIAKVNAKYTFKGVTWTPAVNASYTYASGGSSANAESNFRPWFNMADGYNGYVFAPVLANIQIINVGISAQPAKNTSLALQAYYYMKADKNGSVSSDPNADIGGFNGTALSVGGRDIGSEVDAIVGYDYSKDVRCQLVYGIAIPGDAFDGIANKVVSEVRGEINVKF